MSDGDAGAGWGYWRRALFTFLLIALADLARWIRPPWIDAHDWGMRDAIDGWILVARSPSGLGLASIGTAPMATAFGLTAITFELAPKLRSSLHTEAGERRLLRAAVALTALIALLQSVGIALFMHDALLDLSFKSVSHVLLAAPVVVFGTLFATLPWILERWGIGRGLSAAILAYCLLNIAAALHAIAFDWFVVRSSATRRLDLLAVVAVVIATITATRRFLGDLELLPGEPRLARVAVGVGTALFAFSIVNSFVLSKIATYAAIGAFGHRLFELCSAVGAGLWLAGRQADTSEPAVPPRQLLALGSFVCFIVFIIIAWAKTLKDFPWMETVLATILIYASYAHARRQNARPP